MAELYQYILNACCAGCTVIIFIGWWVFMTYITPYNPSMDDDPYDRL